MDPKTNEIKDFIVKQIGAEQASEAEKAALLDMVERSLEKRFLANLLMSLNDEQRNKLDSKIEAIDKPTIDDIAREATALQPECNAILQRSAEEIIAELRPPNQEEATETTDPVPPTPPLAEPRPADTVNDLSLNIDDLLDDKDTNAPPPANQPQSAPKDYYQP